MAATVQIVTVARQANIVDDINNVFHYHNAVEGAPSSAELGVLLTFFETEVLPAILAFQSDQIVYLELRARHVEGVSFTSTTLGSLDGEIAGSALPPYVAYEFIYRRATALTRNGFKRFAGVIEEAIDQGGNVTGAVATALTAAEPILTLPLEGSGGTFWQPVIYGRPIPSNPTPRIGQVDEVGFQRVTTQNSRKPW